MSKQRNSSSLPAYQQIKRMIVQKINSGEWAPEHLIPSENELTQQFKVSRMTVNRALRELTAQRILVRIQGVGTFVSENKTDSTLIVVRDIADEIQANNNQHHIKICSLEAIAATAAQAELFGIARDTPLFRSLLIHFENDTPVQIEDRLINSKIVPHYLEQNFNLRTPHAYLMSVVPFTEAEHVVEAVLPMAQEASWLAIANHVPCLQLKRRTWDGDNLVSQVRLLSPGFRYRLEGHFFS